MKRGVKAGARTLRLLFLIAAAILAGRRPLAASSSDTVQLLVSPIVTYGVTLTSVNTSGYDFGTVAVNAVTLSTAAVGVRNSGNVLSRWLVSATAEGPDWTLADSTGASNTAVLKALFNSEGGAAPLEPDFNTVNGSTITASARYAAQGTLSTSTVVNSIPANGRRDLYFMLHTPATSSSAVQQRFRVYVTAVP